MDANHDEKLSVTEFLAVLHSNGRAATLFAGLDKNGDGYIDKDELKLAIAEKPGFVDILLANNRQVGKGDWISETAGERSKEMELLMLLDANGDDKITLKEFMEHVGHIAGGRSCE